MAVSFGTVRLERQFPVVSRRVFLRVHDHAKADADAVVERFGVGQAQVDACLLYTSWYRDRDNVEEAMKLAMATGANVAESVGIGDFGHVDEYSKRVAVRKLDRK